MKKVIGTLVSMAMFVSSTGFSAGVCDEFFSTEIQESYQIVSDNENGSCIAEEAALKSITSEAEYLGDVTGEDVETEFKLYQNVTGDYGLYIIDAADFEQQNFIPLAVVLTAVAIDFTLIGVMWGAYVMM